MRYLIGLCALSWVLSTPAAAEHPGKEKGYGHEDPVSQTLEKKAKQAANEAIDVVADELLGEQTTSSGMPPGLAKKGAMPPGLEKQGKTPPGWSKGQKAGWNSTASGPKKESLFRRLIRGIFRRSTAPKDKDAQPQPSPAQ